MLNPNTGTITPQFHCVFDDWFSTVTSDVSALPDFASANWYNMFRDSHYQYVLDDEDVSKLRELDQELEDSYDHCDADRARERVLEGIERSRNDELTFKALPPVLTPQPTSAPVSVHGDKLTPAPVSVHGDKLTPASVPAHRAKLTPVPAVIPTPEINDDPIESPQQPPVQEPTTPFHPVAHNALDVLPNTSMVKFTWHMPCLLHRTSIISSLLFIAHLLIAHRKLTPIP